MSADYRHSGVGWPTGAVDLPTILSLPSPNLLMLSTEGRYHHDEAIRANKKILWRAVPRIGKRPAELKWSPARFMAEALNLTDEPMLPIRDFVFANELDLNTERGDGEDDYARLQNRYNLIGGWAYSLIPMLRQALPGTRLHWPAWTPDHQALDYGHLWRPAADLTDCVDFHAYDSLGQIMAQYHLYRTAFAGKPLALTEWHCKGDLDEERRVLHWLADTMAADSLFDAAYFFIYRWDNHPDWWSDAWDLEHSPARLALFRNPPLAATVSQPPVVVPDPPPPEEPPMPDYPLGIDVASYQGNPDWQIAREQGGLAFAWTKATEGHTYVNSYFARNWFSIKDNGLYRGAYHYGRVANDPTAEADFFVSKVKAQGLEPGDLLALDIEEGAGDLSGWVAAFINRVEQVAGFLPCLYSSPSFIAEHGLGTPEIARAPLWLASWGSQMPAPPSPWPAVSFWQFSDGIDVPGVAGRVDGDYWNGSVERIPLLGKPGSTAPSEPPVDPPAPTDDLSALQARVAALEAQVGGLVTALAVVADDKADVIQKALDEIRGIRKQFIGDRPAA